MRPMIPVPPSILRTARRGGGAPPRLLAAALALLLLVPAGALALSGAERDLLRRSLRSTERALVEKAVGGLDALPLVAVEAELHARTRVLDGFARLDWPNRTGEPRPYLVYRLTANASEAGEPFVHWQELRVAVGGGEPVPVETERLSATAWKVPLPRPAQPGERVVLQGRLLGKLARVEAGAADPAAAGLSALFSPKKKEPAEEEPGYGTFACGLGICTAIGFVPEVPAFLDGDFDVAVTSGIGDPAYSEPMNVLLSVVADARQVIAAGGVETGRMAAPEGRRRVTYALAAAREAGFVASEHFVVDETTVAGVRLRSYSLKKHRPAGKRALKAAAGSLPVFDRAFGAYPWATLDVVESALVGGAGGVELPALTLAASGFYGATPAPLLSLDPAGALWPDLLAFIVRHEVAHQWWHAQVGSHPRLHPYVDEPLSQWAALLATERVEGPEAAARMREMQVAMNFRALGMFGLADGPVARPADEFDDQVEYAGLVYGKAPLFYEALREEIGEKKLLEALRWVVRTYRFRRVTPDELRDALVAAGADKGPRVAALWERWFHGTHGEEDVGGFGLGGIFESFSGTELPEELRSLLGGVDPASLLETLRRFRELMDGAEEE